MKTALRRDSNIVYQDNNPLKEKIISNLFIRQSQVVVKLVVGAGYKISDYASIKI